MRLQGRARVGIVEGDIETSLDADRLEGLGASVALVALSFSLKGLPRLAGAGLLAGYAAFVLLMA